LRWKLKGGGGVLVCAAGNLGETLLLFFEINETLLLPMLGSSSLHFLVAVQWRYYVLVILDSLFASLFLGSRFVTGMILYLVAVGEPNNLYEFKLLFVRYQISS
jgi:hypothetical protein